MRGNKDHKKRKMTQRRKVLIALLLLVIVFLLGPRISIKNVHTKNAIPLPPELDALDLYLKTSEQRFTGDLVPETEKRISWHQDMVGVRTPVSVVFLHGFSGSRRTMTPVPENVAQRLGANLYCNRYAGHGRKNPTGFGEAMTDATTQKWVDDTREALAIGRMLGETVVVVANSTAAPIASWLAGEGDAPDILVLLSPNFGPKDPLAESLLWPWGRLILWLKERDTYTYAPENIYGPEHRNYATTEYPATALLTMMASVKLGRTADFERIRIPALCLYSEHDKVVSPKATKKFFSRLGSKINRIEEVTSVTHREHHVLGGDIMSPSCTPEVVDKIVDFLKNAVLNAKSATTSIR